jgi:hypothetical protein
MATTYKVLGQSAPSATTNTDVYTVPSATEAVISSIAVCNRSASPVSYRVAIRPDGTAIANQHYLAYDVTVNANDTTIMTVGLTMNAADVLTVYASSANLSFGVFGSEIA